ncbi:MAG: GMC family oxidoreductase [Acidimicrobiia bacterium]
MNAIRSFDDVGSRLEEDADFVVVGTGAAGSTAAWVLAEAGHDVLMVEEGPPVAKEDFGDPTFPALATMYRGGGVEAFTGRSMITTLQGRVVGGSTVVNSAIAWRVPESSYDRWAFDPAIRAAFPLEELHRHWDALDEVMSVTPTGADIAGRGNTLAAIGAEAMGWSGKPMNRFTRGCKGSGHCQQGCPNDAKMSTAMTLIPMAQQRGARVLASCRVNKVVLDDSGRATGVEARMIDPVRRRRGPSVNLRARKGVVLAPACLQLPGLLRASGYRHAELGHHFQCHPGASLMPFFDEEVRYWDGATQGWETDEFFEEGMKFEVVNVPVEVNVGRLPGVGRDLARVIRDLRYAGSWALLVRMEAEGRVGGRPGGSTRVSYTPTRYDMERLRRGLHRFAQIAFAAGARRISTGIYGLPPFLEPGQADLILDASLDPRCYTMVATHLFGTARAAGNEKDGVCSPELRPWGTESLWVVDSSVFPKNLGVNPQHMIQAVARHAAERIAG